MLIVAAVTVLLIYGIRESAKTNSIIVMIKVAVVVFVIAFGAFMVNPTNWHPFMPSGFGGVMSGAAIVFFAFIGFDAVSTTAEETKNPQRDLPIGMIASLIICTVLYVLMSGVLTGIKKYTIYLGDSAAVATAFASKPWAQALISAGALAGLTSVLLVFQLGQPRIFMAMARDGLLPRYFSRIHPRFRTPHITTIWTGIVVGGVAMFTDIGSLADLTNIGTLFAFVLVCCRGDHLASEGSESPATIPRSHGSGLSYSWRSLVRCAHVEPANRNVDSVLHLARDRPGDLFPLQRSQQQTGARDRYRRNGKHSSADRAVDARS